MPTSEGSFRTGWLVLFTKEETEAIAESAAATAVIAGLIPEPAISTALGAAAGVVGVAARVAKRKGRLLGVRIKLHSVPNSWKLPSAYEFLAPAVFPFSYRESDPASLRRWRRRFSL